MGKTKAERDAIRRSAEKKALDALNRVAADLGITRDSLKKRKNYKRSDCTDK